MFLALAVQRVIALEELMETDCALMVCDGHSEETLWNFERVQKKLKAPATMNGIHVWVWMHAGVWMGVGHPLVVCSTLHFL